MERALRLVSPRWRWSGCASIATAVAAMTVIGAANVAAQTDGVRRPRGASAAGTEDGLVLGDIRIPFTVGPADCADRARRYAVTMRIYNVLAQPVGIPTLAQSDSNPVPAGVVGRPLTRLLLPCGRYAAYWNGRHVTTGLKLAPGVYLYDLIVDGHRVTRKVTLRP